MAAFWVVVLFTFAFIEFVFGAYLSFNAGKIIELAKNATNELYGGTAKIYAGIHYLISALFFLGACLILSLKTKPPQKE